MKLSGEGMDFKSTCHISNELSTILRSFEKMNSVLAPVLLNTYIAVIPLTILKQLRMQTIVPFESLVPLTRSSESLRQTWHPKQLLPPVASIV